VSYEKADFSATTLIKAPGFSKKKTAEARSLYGAKAAGRGAGSASTKRKLARGGKAGKLARVGKSKGKKPCKYGERVDGYCPPRPSDDGGGRGASGSGSGFGLSPTLGFGGGSRKRTPARSSRAATAARTALKNIAGKAGSKLGPAAARGLGKLAAPAALTGSTIGLALAAGLASYAATTKILNTIKDRKERKAQAAFNAAQAYRLARERAVSKLGRSLTALEHGELSRAFKAELATIGYKP